MKRINLKVSYMPKPIAEPELHSRCYKLINDEAAMQKFIDKLAKLEPWEVYEVSLFAKFKYSFNSKIKTDNSKAVKLRTKFVSCAEELIQTVKDLQMPYGSYRYNGIPIDQNCLVVYINPNPRNKGLGELNAIKEITVRTLGGAQLKLHSIIKAHISKAVASKVFAHFDFDFDLGSCDSAATDTLARLEQHINLNAVTCIFTRRGFHLLVEKNKIESAFADTWYNAITALPGFDKSADMNVPFPGTTQNGIVPSLEAFHI